MIPPEKNHIISREKKLLSELSFSPRKIFSNLFLSFVSIRYLYLNREPNVKRPCLRSGASAGATSLKKLKFEKKSEENKSV